TAGDRSCRRRRHRRRTAADAPFPAPCRSGSAQGLTGCHGFPWDSELAEPPAPAVAEHGPAVVPEAGDGSEETLRGAERRQRSCPLPLPIEIDEQLMDALAGHV